MANQIVWCDIPVLDLDRAVKFYSAVLGQAVNKQEFPGMTVGILPHNEGEVGGCLVSCAEDKPSATGAMIYLNASGRLDDAIAAAAQHGGEGVQPKAGIRAVGFSPLGSSRQGN